MTGHDCDAPVRVLIGQEGDGIPVIDEGVTVHERKDGPLALSRRANVTFPLTDGDTDWYEYIDAYQSGGAMQQATIKMQGVGINGQPLPDTEETVIRGYIGAIGSRGAVNKGQFTILGPYNFLSEIPAGNTFTADSTLSEILRWAMDQYVSGQPVFDNVNIVGDPLDETIVQDRSIPGTEGVIPADATFSWTEARDTLVDVLNFVMDRANVRMWFDPNPDGGITLNVTRGLGERHDATGVGDIHTIFNNALYELRPFNELTLKGTSSHIIDLGDLGTINTHIGSGNYAEATAYYEPLVERAGGRIEQVGESRFGSAGAVEAHASRKLKEMLDDVSGGTMDVALAPFVHPYDTVTARPSCSGIIDSDVPVLDYEVQRTAHTLAPHDPGREPQIPSSELAVSIAIDPDKIKTESKVKDAQPAEGSENEPVEEDPATIYHWGFFD